MPRRGRTAAAGDIGARIRGQVLLPGTSGYERARRVFNAMIDRRPAAIVRCTRADDAVTAVRFARSHALPLAVKGGGHGVAGNAVCDGGLVLDLSPMKHVHVDAGCRTVTAEAGVTLRELDDVTQAFGLATPTGVVSVDFRRACSITGRPGHWPHSTSAAST